MAKLNIFFLLLFFFHNNHLPAAQSKPASGPNQEPLDFIKAECRATRYPALCVQCLSNYSATIQQSQRQLARAALSVSLAWARSAAAFVSRLARIEGMRPTEHAAVKDCVENMGDTVAQLCRSVKELGSMGRGPGQEFEWCVSNVQTWVSAALTDEDTCLDGVSGSGLDGSVKGKIRRRVVGCARVTSNALALVNRFAAKHKAGGSMSGINGMP
ncbi:Plant invertase/pectin methylesterase inhibitor superfamily protein [Striga hermonthica]|uniref:Plant invertase/pectin methylesterase inhibitor superfamily protein n=1 Tax=Striga hermonthica TaxID=68872 RepID=A0A9N7P421_STRHE|nr:Plant invertase/pectin methylesterase inhibitor superfamily protein [Striga hermonthica]